MKKLNSIASIWLLLLGIIASPQLFAAQTQNIIILLGAPGSGKGSQATKLTQELKIPHISTGDLFRDNIKNNTELGKEAKQYMDAGKLVPDSLVTKLLKDRLSKTDTQNGYILDGYPRTVAQAKEFDRIAGKNAKLIVIYLDVSDQELFNRIAKRAQETGGQRSDDTPEIAKERIKVYHQQTAPVINYYKKKGQLTTIDGSKGIDNTYKQIINAYNEKKMPQENAEGKVEGKAEGKAGMPQPKVQEQKQ